MFRSHPDSKEKGKQAKTRSYMIYSAQVSSTSCALFPPVFPTVATIDRFGFMCLGLKISASETEKMTILSKRAEQ